MSSEGCLERLTLAVSKLKEAVGEIRGVYGHMPGLIDDEHAAIRVSDLDRCEEIAQKKVALGNKIDGAFAQLKHTVRGFVEDYRQLSGTQVQSIATLSELFPLIDDALVVLKDRGLQIAVIEHLYDGLKVELEAFLQLKQETYAKIEVNRMVLSRILANRQENYRFWQEVAADALASYDAGGKQKAKKSGSTLVIKA